MKNFKKFIFIYNLLLILSSLSVNNSVNSLDNNFFNSLALEDSTYFETELAEINDSNRDKFWGKSEEMEIEIPNNSSDNIDHDINLNFNFDPVAAQKNLFKKSEKTVFIQQTFFPITDKIPDEILVLIATCLIPEDNKIIKNRSINIYRNIARFLLICKRFYFLKSKINYEIIKIINKNPNPDLFRMLDYAKSLNPWADLCHVAVACNDRVWLTSWILKKREEKSFKDILNTKDSCRNTPMHWAAAHNRYRIVYMLASLGADINCKNLFKNSPLHMAIYKSSINTIHALLRLDANPNVINDRGRVPLHDAVFKNDGYIVRLLLDFSANPNISDNYGKTPLHEAASKSSYNCAYLLILYGAIANLPDISGNTPLHLAVSASTIENLEIVKLLIKNGASRRAINHSAEKPTDVAHKNGFFELEQEMKDIDNNCSIV